MSTFSLKLKINLCAPDTDPAPKKMLISVDLDPNPRNTLQFWREGHNLLPGIDAFKKMIYPDPGSGFHSILNC
jgi:hypothetical protein